MRTAQPWRRPGATRARSSRSIGSTWPRCTASPLYETRDHHAAEDLTEQVFLRALAALPRFREHGEGAGSTFRAWLFTIARNASPTSAAAAPPSRGTPLDAAASSPRRMTRPTTAPIASSWRGAPGRPSTSLPDERRQALVLRFVEEMSAREIGDVMGRSEGAVRVLIHRALRRCDARMSGVSEPDRIRHCRGRSRTRPDAGRRHRRAARGPHGPASADVERRRRARTATAGVAAASRLPRFHPAFGFEERLVHGSAAWPAGSVEPQRIAARATVLAFPVARMTIDGLATQRRSWRPRAPVARSARWPSARIARASRWPAPCSSARRRRAATSPRERLA